MQRTILSILFLFALDLSLADSVSSIRDTSHEWYCENEAGVVISGHVRQDKAFQACYNAALADGLTYYVTAGRYRVTATIDSTPAPDPDPPTEPEPEPEPDPIPDPDPVPEPMVTFGPVTAPINYDPAISALKQNIFTWRIVFTLNSIGVEQGLVSRDESGQTDPGHLSVSVMPDGRIEVRNQSTTDNVYLYSTTIVAPNVEYVVEVSMQDGVALGLFVNDELEAVDPFAVGLTNNSLPLTVGASCQTCSNGVGWSNSIDGTVYVEIYDDAKAIPTGSVVLQWENPTQYENGEPIGVGELAEIRIYESDRRLASVDPDVSGYEVTGVLAGRSYCFEATAFATVESDRSNEVCKEVSQ